MNRVIFSLLGCIVFLLGVMTIPAEGQSPLQDENSPYQMPIGSINVIGVTSADTFMVITSSGLISGDILQPGKVQDAVKGIYALGMFSKVDIEAERTRTAANITINVKEYPKINSLKISGNKKIKRSKFDEVLTVFEGRLAPPKDIKTNVEKIKSLYADKGYLLAEIELDSSAAPNDSNSLDLEFKISEGKKVKIGEISFSGNQVLPDKKLRGKMSTKQKSFFRSGEFDNEKYNEDKDKIITAYKDKGYIDAVIMGDSMWYSPDKTRMFINIDIREGTMYRFGKIDWEGNSVFSDEKIAGGIKFEEGMTYVQKKYDETLAKISELYYDEGYLYLQVDEKSTTRQDTLDFHLKLTENKQAKIRLVHITGNTKTMEKVIRRELMIKPGMIFKRPLLIRSLREVMVLNFFENVTPDLETLPDGDVDLNIQVIEKPTGQFSVGAGYSASDKLVGTVGLGIPNLFGTGQTGTLNLDLGKNRTTFSASYLEPWFLDTPTSLSGSLYLQDKNVYDWYTERKFGGSIQVGRRLRWPDNYFRLFMGYRLEQLNYTDIDSANYIVPNENNDYSVDKYNWPLTTSAASLTILRDSRDLSQFATRGAVFSWRGELAGTVLGGNWDYFKQIYSAEYYKTVFWKFVLMGRAKYGEIEGIDDKDADIPYSERFAPGGVDPDGTIRGYDDARVGPYDSQGAYLRGRFMLTYNVELTLPIAEQQFYLIAFADAGNAYLSLKDIHLTKGYYRSVGVGFRIAIPLVGIMGFDFGYPFDGAEKGSWKPHFQIGRGF